MCFPKNEQPVVTPPAPPPPPPKALSPLQASDPKTVNRAKPNVGGYLDTIMTSQQGDLTPAKSARRTLLGA